MNIPLTCAITAISFAERNTAKSQQQVSPGPFGWLSNIERKTYANLAITKTGGRHPKKLSIEKHKSAATRTDVEIRCKIVSFSLIHFDTTIDLC
jgi:hypothetical protein